MKSKSFPEKLQEKYFRHNCTAKKACSCQTESRDIICDITFMGETLGETRALEISNILESIVISTEGTVN